MFPVDKISLPQPQSLNLAAMIDAFPLAMVVVPNSQEDGIFSNCTLIQYARFGELDKFSANLTLQEHCSRRLVSPHNLYLGGAMRTSDNKHCIG